MILEVALAVFFCGVISGMAALGLSAPYISKIVERFEYTERDDD